MRPTTSVPEHGLAASHFVVAPHEGRTLLMTPRESGFSMPAEWAPHSGCWMAWPSRTDLWGGNLGAVQQGYVAVASAIAQFEPVWMVASPDAAQAARHACGPSIRVIPLSIDDAWIRDSGPTFLTHPARGLAGTAWRFNAWGGKSSRYADDARLAGRLLSGLSAPAYHSSLTFEGGGLQTDGAGTVITTESVVLNRVVVPARQAYSHCASVGNTTVLPVFFDNHWQNAWASSHDTFTTG